jgi:hypothetical protein
MQQTHNGVHEFHDQHDFADTSATKQSSFPTFDKRTRQVNRLDA